MTKGKHLWAWGYFNKNFQNWKKEKTCPRGKKKKRERLYKHCGRTVKGKTIYLLGIPEEDRKEEKKIFEAVMTISPNECQTLQVWSSENTDQDRRKKQNKTTHLVISYSNFKKTKIKKSWRKAKKKKKEEDILSTEEQR